MKFQVRGSINIIYIFSEVISISTKKWMMRIGRKRFDRDTVKSFVKYTMYYNFTSLRLHITPNDMLCGIRYITKEDTFLSFIFETLCLDSWRADPDLTAKSTQILEVVFASSRKMNRRRALTITRRSISNT